ncbi:MAG: SRPBCC family protein [Chloroflexota bacterium]|nr:MAG: SRPBCC family protein [Chloroflexota bacterium]
MKLSYTMDFKCTPEQVWYWLGTPERAMKWQTNISKTEILEETPNMIGTTFRETIEENGSGVEMQGIVTDYKENESLAMHMSGKYNVVDVEWRIEEMGEYTRLTLYSDIRFKSLVKILSIFMRPVFKKRITEQLRGEFARLKELCERDN